MNEEFIKALEEREKIDHRFRLLQEFERSLDRVEIRDLREHLIAIEKYLVKEKELIN